MRGSKKSKPADEADEESRMGEPNICKFEDSHSCEDSSPEPARDKNCSLPSTSHSRYKTRRLFKPTSEPALAQEQLQQADQIKIEVSDSELSSFEESQSPGKVGSERQVPTLDVGEDIKTYYQLLELAESLDALIIKYYKDPLLSTILMDSSADCKPPPQEPQQSPPANGKEGGTGDFSTIKMEEEQAAGGEELPREKVKL
jgi:hypothetical protein